MKNSIILFSVLFFSMNVNAQLVDCGISAYLAPGEPTDGAELVQVSLRNYGETPINSVDIHSSINGIAKRTYTYNGALPPGKKIDLYLFSFRFNRNGTYKMEFYTSNPNGILDGNTSNDTLLNTFKGELDLENNDAGIVSILAPTTISDGYKLVRVRLKNFGIDPIENVEVAWKVNGVDQRSYFYKGPTLRSRREIDLYIGGFVFVEGVDYIISSRIVLPNGKADEKPINDRAVKEY